MYVNNVSYLRPDVEKASVRFKKLLLLTGIVNSLQFYVPMSQLAAGSALLASG